jgi:CheY-like chemotaxis protein
MKKQILIIDDDPIYRMIVSRTISRIDASLSIDECENGQIGLSMLEHGDSTNTKIIILLDINMPIIDGWVFLDQIKANNFYNISQVLIYLVSSSTDESDLLKAKQYGFLGGFLHKPLQKEDICSILTNN